jgi:uncharacterized protein YcbX
VGPVGRVIEIWRYPVSSLGGEPVRAAGVSPAGIAGDRQYGLIDLVTGLPAAPEKDRRWRKALYLQATSIDGEAATILFPGGDSCSVADVSLNGRLSDYFGFATSIAVFERDARHPGFPLTRHRQHHFPMHVLTTASIRRLAALRQVETIDSRRFRPSVLIDVREVGGFVENAWIGRRLRLGAIGLTASDDTRRCGMTVISQPGLDEDPEILRNILRHNRRHFGIHCSIEGSGTIRLGDELIVAE